MENRMKKVGKVSSFLTKYIGENQLLFRMEIGFYDFFCYNRK